MATSDQSVHEPQEPQRAEGAEELGGGLQRRHLDLIALGGVIGAGLFVGSGVVITQAGPAAVLSFLAAGIITILVMRMLAEMAVQRPVVGSFSVYAREAFGPRGGFVVGWLYWYFFVIVVAIEAVAGAQILTVWWPQVPVWVFGLVLLAALTATNLVSARSYGEFEYWFSSIKVIAIVLFLAAGVLWVTGLFPGSTPGVANLWRTEVSCRTVGSPFSPPWCRVSASTPAPRSSRSPPPSPTTRGVRCRRR